MSLACLNIHHIYKQIKGNKHDPTTKLFFTRSNSNSSFFLEVSYDIVFERRDAICFIQDK